MFAVSELHMSRMVDFRLRSRVTAQQQSDPTMRDDKEEISRKLIRISSSLHDVDSRSREIHGQEKRDDASAQYG